MFQESIELSKEVSAPVSFKVPVPRQLLHVNTTTVNQLLGLPGLFSTFVAKDLRGLRIAALTASSASIVACTASIFFLFNIDRRRRVFRHDLVLFLIICDFVKAIVLMIYPLVILVRNDVYADPRFYNTLGWFTAYCVEGADLAIFFFAIHFALLIFLPSRKWRRRGSHKMEGGLYGIRRYIWPITALAPVVLASLAFINMKLLDLEELQSETTVVLDNDTYHFRYDARIGGYKPYSAWCYLPPYPLWYKLVLSWGPRYFIIVFILVLYISIYVFVRRESKRIKKHLHDFKDQRTKEQVAKLRAKSKWGFFKFKLFRIFVKPVISFLFFLKSFLSFSFEDTSVPASGRNSIISEGSLYVTDEDTSSDQVPSVTFHPGRGSFPRKKSIARDCSQERGRYDDNRLKIGKQETPAMNNSRCAKSDGEQLDDWRNDLGGISSSVPKKTDPGKPEAAHAGKTQSNRTLLSPIQSLYVKKGPSNSNDYHENCPPIKKDSTVLIPTVDVKNVQADFQKQTYAAMKSRRTQIQKNLRSIFIYPFSYIGIWLFPLVVDITQYHREIIHGPLVWLIYLATIAQPLNGLVDTLVFVYREKPWRYSWSKVQFQELLDAYSLKEGLGENDIRELYHSDLGMKGWYYCGRYNRICCWKHKPERWKQAAWYIYRFLCGVVRNKYDFEDTCDALPPDYNQHDNSACFNLSKFRCEQHERQFSSPSDSTSGTGAAQSRQGSDTLNGYVSVPVIWRALHLLPMLKGIDLDELDRQIRHRNVDHDFVLPGLQLALGKSNDCKANSEALFKPEYSVRDEKKTTSGRQNGEGPHTQVNSVPVGLNANADFSDVVNTGSGALAKGSSRGPYEENDEDKMGMLAFLKGPMD